MRIGLTGATGFIGQYLIKMYGCEHEFVAITSKEQKDKYSSLAVYIKADYSIENFEKIFSGCEAVIHLGGRVMHGMDNSMDVSNYVENVELCENVFRACKNIGIKNVVFASSVAVYDQQELNPVSEEGKCQPNSIYGVMKIAAEKIAEIYNRKYGMCIKILRIAQVLGLRERLDIKQFWDKILLDAYNNRAICLYGKGFTGRDVIYVKDVVRALILAVQKYALRGVYNIGTGHICTNLELAETYNKVWSNNKKIYFDMNKTETGIQTCMNCEKAKKELGFEVKYDVKAMVEDIKESYLSELEEEKN